MYRFSEGARQQAQSNVAGERRLEHKPFTENPVTQARLSYSIKPFRASQPAHFAHYNLVRLHKTLRVTPAMAAGMVDRLSVRTLERHRVAGTGPRRARLGRLVRYRQCDLTEWIENNLRDSTSQTATHERPATARS
jgi:hypothetical protein